MAILKRDLDLVIKLTRKFWASGDADFLTARHAVCERIEHASGVDADTLANVTDAVFSPFALKKGLASEDLYKMLAVCGLEVA